MISVTAPLCAFSLTLYHLGSMNRTGIYVILGYLYAQLLRVMMMALQNHMVV